MLFYCHVGRRKIVQFVKFAPSFILWNIERAVNEDSLTELGRDATKTLTKMADENMNAMIPNLEYRLFMLQLSHHFSPEDMEDLKYVSAIPRGIGEKLTTPLKLLDHLECRGLVEPNNLYVLETLFSLMKKENLSSMVASFTFIENNDNRIIDSL